MIYDTLYRKDENNNVRVWWMEQDEDRYRTIAGIKNGNLVYSEWTVAEGKNLGKTNETSGSEQAKTEILAQYKKKTAKKYHESEDTIDDGAKYIVPMLANKYSIWGKGKLAWTSIYTQPKLDGCRCIATIDGLYSREGKEFLSAPHITRALAPYFEKNPDAILDGELYNHDLRENFNSIISLIKKKEPTFFDLQESERMIQYHVYDTITDDKFSVRTSIVADAVAFANSPSIVRVPTFEVDCQETLDRLYGEFMQDGYEGSMIRFDVPYEQKRSNSLLKRKEFQDAEFEIVRLEAGLGNWSNGAKIAVCRLKDGREFGAGVKGNQEFAKELLLNRDRYVGGTVTVRYQNLTPDLVPRFPIAVAFFEGKRDI